MAKMAGTHGAGRGAGMFDEGGKSFFAMRAYWLDMTSDDGCYCGILVGRLRWARACVAECSFWLSFSLAGSVCATAWQMVGVEDT